VINQAANLLGIDSQEIQRMSLRTATNCPCPHCNPGSSPNNSCRSIRHTVSK
jgi:hypothetical protein